MGPLEGVRVVEIAGRGPGPFAGMMLSDMGAEVIRVDRPRAPERPQSPDAELELVFRGRRSVLVDLKEPGGAEVVLRLVEGADALYEGYRPGVAERLGIGAEHCLSRNPRLVYARATGWGQTGPLAQRAGHDINYIALAGALEPIGHRGGPPEIPLNLVGDYAGGGMLLAFGIVCGVLESRTSGQGQVIDAAMLDGASLLMTLFHGRRAAGVWSDERGTNYIDSGAPFYNVYETKDSRYVAVGAIEAKFHQELLRKIGIECDDASLLTARERWPELHEQLTRTFKTRTRDEWATLLEGTDSCLTPVLGLGEVADHPHNVARESFIELGGVRQPAPAPRFSRTRPEVRRTPPVPGNASYEVLVDWGFTTSEVDDLVARRVVHLKSGRA